MIRAIVLLAGVALTASASVAQPASEADRVSPFGATPGSVVTANLEMAAVGPGDLVVDLGSGDGRLAIAAARDFGARGYGVDIDAGLVDYARRWASEAGVAERAAFDLRDLFKANYLCPTITYRLAAKLGAELGPGTRVVTHDHVLPGWRVDRVRVVDAPVKFRHDRQRLRDDLRVRRSPARVSVASGHSSHGACW